MLYILAQHSYFEIGFIMIYSTFILQIEHKLPIPIHFFTIWVSEFQIFKNSRKVPPLFGNIFISHIKICVFQERHNNILVRNNYMLQGIQLISKSPCLPANH